MSVREYSQKHTHREHLTWLAFIEEQETKPNKTDHYLMQLTLHVVRLIHLTATHKDKEFKLSDFELQFNNPNEPKKPLTKEQRLFNAAQSRRAWLGGLTGGGNRNRGLVKTVQGLPPGMKRPFGPPGK